MESLITKVRAIAFKMFVNVRKFKSTYGVTSILARPCRGLVGLGEKIRVNKCKALKVLYLSYFSFRIRGIDEEALRRNVKDWKYCIIYIIKIIKSQYNHPNYGRERSCRLYAHLHGNYLRLKCQDSLLCCHC